MAPNSQNVSMVQTRAAKKTLLIVDDEPQVIKSILRILRKQNLDILTASSGEEAIGIIHEAAYHHR